MPIRLAGKRLFLTSPDARTAIWANVCYTRRSGTEQCCIHYYERRDDLYDAVYRRYSLDNGRTWTEAEEVPHVSHTEAGTLRTWRYGGGMYFVDPERDLLVRLYNEARLPTDRVSEYLHECTVRYAVSADGGRTNLYEAPVIQKGDGHDERHPLPGVTIGRNGVAIGGSTCRPVRNRRGQILQPVDIAPLGPDGRIVNPGGGPDYTDTAVLIGTWTETQQLEWELSRMVIADPQRTTRGLMETTLAPMPDGRVLMVLRGSNANRPELPGYRWYAVSEDDGYTWTEARPWRYTDGETFYSPASSSQFLQHSNGETYWLANILPDNPRGNLPRYPLVIGQVDPESLLLRRETLFVIDDRQPNQHESLQLSNFLAYEDRETGEIVINCTHFLAWGEWNGDAYEYRLSV